ncbi:MAG: hypothetical protein IJB83_02270 [Bacilli bacterium]|nr:hypothetical protein [Bacilli bacterium]
MEKKRLYIDFDGVVLDTISMLYKAFDETGINPDDKVKVAEFYEEFDFETIVNDDLIINNSIDNIRKLVDSNLFEISFLTHIHSLDEGVIKVKYVRKYFKDISVILAPREISKTMIVHSEGAILVDDYSGNLKEWEEAGGIAIRFNQKLDSKGYNTINDLSKLIDMFKE